LRTYWSHPLTIADVLGARRSSVHVRLHLFTPFPIVVQLGAMTPSTSPISKLRAANDERRQAKRGERRKVEMDLGPVRYLATLLGADSETVLRWSILVVALLLDPAAALLLSVSARRED
jgi:hypothetical protein